MTTENGIGFHRMVDIATGDLRPARIATPDGLDEAARARVQHHIDAGRIQIIEDLNSESPDVVFVRSGTDFSKKGQPQVVVPDGTSLILRLGDGINNAPQPLLASSGTLLDHTPGNNTEFVARRNLALLMALLDRFPATSTVEPGTFQRKNRSLKPGQIEGSTIAIMGFGNIGTRTAELLRSVYGDDIRIVYTDIEDKKSPIAEYRHCDDLDAALREANIAITTVSGDSLENPLMGQDQFAALLHESPGAIYINTSRGAAVDEDSMKNFCIHQGGYVGIDVARNESGQLDEPIRMLQAFQRAIVTPHTSAKNPQAEYLNGVDALQIGLDHLFTGAINPRSHPKILMPNMHLRTPDFPVYRLSVRYADNKGVSGKIGDTVSAAGCSIDREVIDRSTAQLVGEAQMAAGIFDIEAESAQKAAQIARLIEECCRELFPMLGMELRQLGETSFPLLKDVD